MELNLKEIAYEMLKKIEFYGLESEIDYKYDDFKKTIKNITENKLLAKDYYALISICSQTLSENI
ncbi:hypothetical protein [Cetobacterium sp. ZOR0034]|uniref:hypothetical protein n=1 Tax=Cetobacterium sp. ZOR0034 TaxID=1339239 RepID=UPI000646F288|nr:hypothetical protein [Cetobacterium sp. ZOR0034]